MGCFSTGDRVCETGTGRGGTVLTTIACGAALLVDVDDLGLGRYDADGWELEDGCVVERAPLARLVNEFVTTWKRDRPPANRGRVNYAASTAEPVDAHDWLAADCGLPVAVIRNQVVSSKRRYAELRVADALVASIGEPGMYYDGTLSVVPNPRASSRGDACCGGSTPDFLTG